MVKKERCAVFAGAPIADYKRIKAYLRPDDYIVYCDRGLRHKRALDLPADLIVGDFDSCTPAGETCEIIALPRKKDDTDSLAAIKVLLERGYRDFLLAGVIGERLDHSLANLAILLYLEERQAEGKIIDDYGEISLVGRQTAEIENDYSYFSLINIYGTAKGISIIDAAYPLTDAEITCSYPYGVSNEVLPGKTAKVKVAEGHLLLLKIR